MLKLAVTTLTAITLIAFAFATGDGVEAQSHEEGATLEVRVIVKPHDDGGVEFGVEYDSERILPRGRFLSVELADARVGEWLSSTPVELIGPAALPAVLGGANEYGAIDNLWELPGFGRAIEIVRVYARPYADGRVEFMLGHNGQSLIPKARFLTPTLKAERAGEWLRSTSVDVVAQIPPAETVREFSLFAYNYRNVGDDRTLVDVARECALTRLTNPSPDIVSGIFAHGLTAEFKSLYPNIVSRVTKNNYYSDRLAAGVDPAAMYTNQPYSYRWHESNVADHYAFVLENERDRLPSEWWVAEFTCVEPESSSQNVEPDDGDSGSLE